VKKVAGSVVVGVVDYVVVAHLGPDENMSPHVVPDPGSSVDLEVVGTDVVIAGETVGAVGKIEASSLPANASHQIQSNLLAQARLVNAIEGEKDGAVGLTNASKVPLTGPPVGIKCEADALVKDHVATEVGVQATFLRTNNKETVRRRQAALSRTRRHERSEAEIGVALLSGSKVSQGKDSKNRRDEGKLSQEEPPVMIFLGGKMPPPNRLDASAWTMHSS
jgi:hypothetical protein